MHIWEGTHTCTCGPAHIVGGHINNGRLLPCYCVLISITVIEVEVLCCSTYQHYTYATSYTASTLERSVHS